MPNAKIFSKVINWQAYWKMFPQYCHEVRTHIKAPKAKATTLTYHLYHQILVRYRVQAYAKVAKPPSLAPAQLGLFPSRIDSQMVIHASETERHS